MAEKLSIDITNAHGTVMLSANKIHVRDGKIVMDGNLMGSMPGQFYVSPINIYKATKMVDFATIKQIIKMLRQGKKEFKAQQV